MRKLLTLLLTFSGLSVAALGHAADGTVDLTWGVTCTPIVQNITPVVGTNSLMASVSGNDQTHSGYQVAFLFGSAAHTVPDAWRFDAAGCQTESFITINHLPPGTASKTCPAFHGPVSVLQIKEFKFVDPASIYDATLFRGLLANAYPNGNTTLAANRYFLAQFIFDHTFSVTGPGTPGSTCGGFETPMCVALLQGIRSDTVEGSSTKYATLIDGVEHPFAPSSNNWLTTHGLAGCPATPVENKTWGQIKSQYRN
jgi:hypothetical protein